MAVKNWHFGKIVILWVCGLFPFAVLSFLASVGRGWGTEEIIGILLPALIFPLGFLVPITWKWLSGKEKRD